jgi:hypothetical protein
MEAFADLSVFPDTHSGARRQPSQDSGTTESQLTQPVPTDERDSLQGALPHLAILVHSIYELGIQPVFWAETTLAQEMEPKWWFMGKAASIRAPIPRKPRSGSVS